MTTISSKGKLYRDLSRAIGDKSIFNSARYAYESGESYAKISKLVALGVETEILIHIAGYDFEVDTSMLLPEKIGDISTEGFAEMLDDQACEMLEYILSCDTEPTKEKVLGRTTSFRRPRYESTLDLLKSRRVVTESGGKLKANLTKKTYELIRKVYKV